MMSSSNMLWPVPANRESRSWRFSPGTNSNTMYAVSPVVAKSNTWTMFGWRSWATAVASSWKRRMKSGFIERC